MSAPNANVLLHLLERSHPDEYAPPKQRTEVTGKDGGPQVHVVADAVDKMAPDDLMRAARALLDGGPK